MEMLRNLALTVFLSLLGFLFLFNSAECCNEAVCASIVSKCMLMQSCKCELTNSTCCNECLICLGKEYYEECCSCVELCVKANGTRNSLLSHVEEFNGIPDLFNVLAFSDGINYNWHRLTFPVDFDTILSVAKLDKDVKYYLKTSGENRDEAIRERNNVLTLNCTVLFLDQCTSWNKCRQICQSTGASSYRWFHDGCCECIGSTCINYGLNESRCRQCPESRDDIDETFDDDMLDYGDELGPFDV
uniref:Protein twisted gastrulation n=1 Tax=Glossina palpalis gambiensis TaxID=67801 RepID=A0A1B0BY88_9MUSC